MPQRDTIVAIKQAFIWALNGTQEHKHNYKIDLYQIPRSALSPYASTRTQLAIEQALNQSFPNIEV